jgi:peptidoglycan-associated lipoprotein
MKRKVRDLTVGVVLLLLIGVSCKKKTAVQTPPTPTPAAAGAAPTVSLTVEPSSIQRGNSATLRWSSQNATEVTIQPAIGAVEAQGTRSVSPAESTTFTATARGAGGTAQATARLTVTAPPPPSAAAPAPRGPTASVGERFNREVQDAFFDFDKADIRNDARANLTKSADFLRANPNVNISVEGHCDERGSAAYNLGLGDRRSNAVKDFLSSLGISSERMKTISYGKERPFCTDRSEACWQQNRRGHLVCDNCGQ